MVSCTLSLSSSSNESVVRMCLCVKHASEHTAFAATTRNITKHCTQVAGSPKALIVIDWSSRQNRFSTAHARLGATSFCRRGQLNLHFASHTHPDWTNWIELGTFVPSLARQPCNRPRTLACFLWRQLKKSQAQRNARVPEAQVVPTSC